MLNKISLALADESGKVVTIDEKPFNVEIKLDTKIIELWTQSLEKFKSITDEELRHAQKFEFINLVTNFLQENREDDQPF
ncbi:MAG: hypothetical protein K1X72_23290 [Pyrinomonadaceae bacterium]|nr:hypothetical protein [Pyrinomonadaceae bacterium]